MATIVKRRKADGSFAHRADIRIKKDGKITYQESKTFSRAALAKDWARQREIELGKPGAIDRVKIGDASIGTLIKRYIDEYATISNWQRSKHSDLKRLINDSIASIDATALTTQILVKHAKTRRANGAGPATVINDFVWLHAVYKTARTAWGMTVSPEVIAEAKKECLRTKLIGRAKGRTRRPTADEIKRLEKHFESRDKRSTIPMVDIMWFAIYSTRREAEICRLEWKDMDPEGLTGWVKDLKDPHNKIGNHQQFKFTRQAWEIVERQPRTGPFIFPYNPNSVCSAFTGACKLLGIEDLRFHDLRHEAVSRLFEQGYSIQEVAMFSLHRSWTDLRRYTNLRPEKFQLRS